MSIQQTGGMKAPSVLTEGDLVALGNLISNINKYISATQAGGSHYTTVKRRSQRSTKSRPRLATPENRQTTTKTIKRNNGNGIYSKLSNEINRTLERILKSDLFVFQKSTEKSTSETLEKLLVDSNVSTAFYRVRQRVIHRLDKKGQSIDKTDLKVNKLLEDMLLEEMFSLFEGGVMLNRIVTKEVLGLKQMPSSRMDGFGVVDSFGEDNILVVPKTSGDILPICLVVKSKSVKLKGKKVRVAYVELLEDNKLYRKGIYTFTELKEEFNRAPSSSVSKAQKTIRSTQYRNLRGTLKARSVTASNKTSASASASTSKSARRSGVVVQTANPALYSGATKNSTPLVYAEVNGRERIYGNIINKSLIASPEIVVDFTNKSVKRTTIKQEFLKNKGDFMFAWDGNKYFLYLIGINSQGKLIYGKYEIEALPSKYRLINISNTGVANDPIITSNKTVQSIIDAKQLDGMNLKTPNPNAEISLANMDDTAASGKSKRGKRRSRKN
jgi:hypothetical protein